ncbi:MAG: S26 family signal peptidase [Nanoarchaeota archaeon]|nr:S26 family signal peptidase [Nanoarchaeota archaeon]
MDSKELFRNIRKAWRWIWDSDSILSWIVALVVIFIFVKFIFFPSLSLIMGTSLPLAGVESSSMDHQIVKDDYGYYALCQEHFNKEELGHINFDEYWSYCGPWYENRKITKEDFSEFTMKNGFRKGDIVVVWGRFIPKIGDIIIFKPNEGSIAPRPIIHRIIKIEDGVISTKGDHNSEQLVESNNNFKTDEKNIKKDQIIGKAIMKIPYLGYVKIWATELLYSFVNLL